jgi:predicted ATPase/DNA-binding SARP family transcriptional activator
MSKLSIYLLGAPRLEVNSQTVEPDTRKAIALLAYLVITEERHTRDKLAAFLWPEYDQSRSKAALRRTLSALKSAISGYGLDIRRDSIGLKPSADIWLDVHHFRRFTAQCHEHDHPADTACSACLTPLSKAVKLYHGDFLDGFSLRDSLAFDEWQYLEGEILRRELAIALQRLVQCQQTQGQYASAIKNAQRLLGLDTLSEQAHRLLMTLYALDGQRVFALRQYRECVRILDEELGVSPLEETTSLYERILSGEILVEKEEHDEGEITARDILRIQISLPLVGRAAEWTRLLDQYHEVDAGGRLVVLEGEAGIGKTRLAQAFLNYVRQEGAITIGSQCNEGESGLVYAPFVESISDLIRFSNQSDKLKTLPIRWLSEVTRLVPDLASLRPDLPVAPALDNPGAQNRFFEAICQILLALCSNSRPGVLYLEDLQWCDEASLDLLSYLVRRLHNYPLFVLVSWQGELLSADHHLYRTFARAQHAGSAQMINLGRLDELAVRELVHSVTGVTGTQESLALRLYEETEGLPYFLVEYLAMLELPADDLADPANSNQKDHPDIAPSLPMPAGVRDLLRSRMAPVSETGRQLLHAAAVIGRSFDFDALRSASGRSEEETIVSLEELLARGLVVERSAESDSEMDRNKLGAEARIPSVLPVYDFSHEKLRTLVYEETSLARRRLLHRRVAQELVGRQGVLPGASRGSYAISQVAYHYQHAGLEETAAEYYKQAGDQARELYANAEALSHYQAALALGYGDSVFLHEAIGDLHTLRGEYDDALASYEAAAALLEPSSQPVTLARLETKLGGVYHRRGDWALAASYYEQARPRLTEEGQQARLLTDWSLTLYHSGDGQKAQEMAEKAIKLAQVANDPQALAQAQNIMGILANSRGEAILACQYLEQSLALAEGLQNPTVKIATLNNLSLAQKTAGEMDQALQLAKRALALCLDVGDRHREAALHNNLADLYHAMNQPEQAMAHLKQAVTIYADIGGDVSKWQPEIWKLTEW